MASEILGALLAATVALTAALALVALLRRPLRNWLGARAAYWIWLLPPLAVVAALGPVPANLLPLPGPPLPALIAQAQAGAHALVTASDSAAGWLQLWGIGVLGACAVLAHLQRGFVAGLGELVRDGEGHFRSARVAGPALVGAWRPRLVLPADFEARYGVAERALVLAHETTHLRRGDALANALAAFGLCLFWFHPLAYWALGRYRFDQELACDEDVLSADPSSRRRYAEAMLKTQLATDSGWRLPAGCHWQACHPLKERISMLKRPLPTQLRRRCGTAFAVVLSVGVSITAWAAAGNDPVVAQRRLTQVVAGDVMDAPVYPADLMSRKVEGSAVVDVLISAEGTVQDVRVVSSKPAGAFDQASIDAARKWKFVAGRNDNGKPLVGWVRVALEFKL